MSLQRSELGTLKMEFSVGCFRKYSPSSEFARNQPDVLCKQLRLCQLMRLVELWLSLRKNRKETTKTFYIPRKRGRNGETDDVNARSIHRINNAHGNDQYVHLITTRNDE